MKRRRHPILLMCALLMFGFTLALWVRSYWQWETVYTETVYDGPPEYHYTRYLVVLEVNSGNASFFFSRDLTPPKGHWKLAHFARPGHQSQVAEPKARWALHMFGFRHNFQDGGFAGEESFDQYEVAWPMWFSSLLIAVPLLLLMRSTIKMARGKAPGFDMCSARSVIG